MREIDVDTKQCFYPRCYPWLISLKQEGKCWMLKWPSLPCSFNRNFEECWWKIWATTFWQMKFLRCLKCAFTWCLVVEVKLAIFYTLIYNYNYDTLLFEQNWDDVFLVWDPESYSGIHLTRLHIQNIWKPDVVLWNRSDDIFESAKAKIA